VAASKNAHRKAGMIAVRNVRFWGFYVPFSWSNRRLAQQANRLSWGRRFCTAAFCQALTAFFAVRPIVLSCWPRTLPSAIQRLSAYRYTCTACRWPDTSTVCRLI